MCIETPPERTLAIAADAECRSARAGEQCQRCRVLYTRSRHRPFIRAAVLPLAMKTSRRVIYEASLSGRKAEPHRRVKFKAATAMYCTIRNISRFTALGGKRFAVLRAFTSGPLSERQGRAHSGSGLDEYGEAAFHHPPNPAHPGGSLQSGSSPAIVYPTSFCLHCLFTQELCDNSEAASQRSDMENSRSNIYVPQVLNNTQPFVCGRPF